VDDRSLQLRLHDPSLLSQTWELSTWESLVSVADPQRIVSATALERAAKEWETTSDIIDSELRQHGYRTVATSSSAPSPPPGLSPERIAVSAGGALVLFSLIMIVLPVLREIWFLCFALGGGAVIWGIGQLARTAFVREQAKTLLPDLTPLGV